MKEAHWEPVNPHRVHTRTTFKLQSRFQHECAPPPHSDTQLHPCICCVYTQTTGVDKTFTAEHSEIVVASVNGTTSASGATPTVLSKQHDMLKRNNNTNAQTDEKTGADVATSTMDTSPPTCKQHARPLDSTQPAKQAQRLQTR